ncbi:MAG: peptidylprolyl isomerase [Acidobacteria bacterium]|nr:peptidylprolyl isomerase [Acidobacteriota bacterium]
MLKNKLTLQNFCYLVLAVVITLNFSSLTLAQKRKPVTKPKTTTPAPTPTPTPVKPPEPETIRPPETLLSVEEMEKLVAVVELDENKEFTLAFYPKSAPNHVRQFIWLARSGYFNGMSISRVIPKYIVQSGNPGSWEENNPNLKKRFDIPKLKAEYDQALRHEKGSLSMARPNGEPDGGTSHFFICTERFPSLDNQYSIFGHVVSGMEIVNQLSLLQIAEGTTDKPAQRVAIKQILIKEIAALPAETTPKETELKTNDSSN